MLHKETVEAGTLDLIKRFMRDPKIDDFTLVGGTALSLRIGHRKSIDIDLFTTQPFNVTELARHLADRYQAGQVGSTGGSVMCLVSEVKVDLITHQYKELQKPEQIEGIRLSSLQDIAAMKLNAIAVNGTRYKDFVDVFFLLEYLPLREILNCYTSKYPDVNPDTARASLLYYQDISKTSGIDFVKKEVPWEKVKERLQTAVKNERIVFSQSQRKRQHPTLVDKKRQSRKPGSGLSR